MSSVSSKPVSFVPVTEALWRDPKNLEKTAEHFRDKNPDHDVRFFVLLKGQSVKEALASIRAVEPLG